MLDRIRLLHIEDNADYRELMETTIRIDPGLQFDYRSAATLAEGLAALKQRVFDVVLLDWMLPDSTGVDSIAAIRSIDPNVAIIVFTGHDSDAIVAAAKTAGADGFLLKGLSNIKTILTTLHFAACKRQRRDDRVIAALEAMLEGLESATDSVERMASSGESDGD